LGFNAVAELGPTLVVAEPVVVDGGGRVPGAFGSFDAPV